MSEAQNKLAEILRVNPSILLDLEAKMDLITGKTGQLEKIYKENQERLKETLSNLGLDAGIKSAKEISDALLAEVKKLDRRIFKAMGEPDLGKNAEANEKISKMAFSVHGRDLSKPIPPTGFFLKKEKAQDLLEKFPPHNMLEHFGYKNVNELVQKEGFSSIFSALRFSQDDNWMHEFFESAYSSVNESDFERRPVEIKILETKWPEVAKKYMKHKLHNVSHLKELGIIFIVPLPKATDGETLRMFLLILHYLNEVPFYSRLFEEFSRKPDFPPKFKSLLRGDVPEKRINFLESMTWRIVQRYLAKDDPNDFRLFEPHVNPEADHWFKAIADLDAAFADLFADLKIKNWTLLDFIGDFFNSSSGAELISFDLIDLAMDLFEKRGNKYLYHQQEALWNQIFIEYMGREKMNKLIEENIVDGFINLRS